MEVLVENMNVYGQGCIGCQRHNKEVMLTFTGKIIPNTSGFVDVFTTTKEAKILIEELTRIVELNEKEDENVGK